MMPRPCVVEANLISRPIEEMNPALPSPVIEEASSTGSIIATMVVLTPVTVDARMLVRPTEEMKLAEPRPVTVLVSSVGSIMEEMLLLVPATLLMRFCKVSGCCPLIEDTMISGAVRLPVLIWRVERDVVMRSPMLI